MFISLPSIKGYAFYDNADPFTHIGAIIDILQSGYINSDNFYPIMHMWVAILSIFVNISPFELTKHIPIIIFIIFFVSFFLWNKTIFSDKNIVIISTAYAAILFLKNSYYIDIVPNGFSLMLVPLIMYIYSKKLVEYKILFVILLFLIVFSHPLTTMILGIIFIIYELSVYLYNNWMGKINNRLNFNSVLILLILFISWISTFYIWNKSILRLVPFIKGELSPPADAIGGAFSKLDMDISERLLWILKMYFPNIVIVLLAIMAAIYIIVFVIRNRKNNRSIEIENLFPAAVSFFVIGVLLMIMLFMGDPGIESIRSFSFVFLLAIPLAGYSLFKMHIRIKSNPFNSFILILLMLGLPYGVALSTLYDSPYIKLPGRHVSFAQLDGMEWFFMHKNRNIQNTMLSAATPWRFSDVLYGLEIKKNMTDLSRYRENWIFVPDHFKNLSQNSSNRYFIVNKFDYVAHIQVWSKLNRYNETDFIELEKNEEIIKIYSNGDVTVRYISS